MNTLKLVVAGLLVSSAAFAQDAPAGDPPADPNAAAAPDPNAGAAAAPAPAPAAGDGGVMKKMTVGADLAFILPLGDYSDGASAAFGVLGRFEYAINPQLSATARIGFIYNLLKDVPDGVSASLNFIPIMVGASYKIGTSGLFGYGELGFTNIRASASAGGQDFSDSETKFAIGAGVGYQKDKIKARAGFYMPGSESSDNGMGGTTTTTLYGIMVSGGYDFASF